MPVDLSADGAVLVFGERAPAGWAIFALTRSGTKTAMPLYVGCGAEQVARCAHGSANVTTGSVPAHVDRNREASAVREEPRKLERTAPVGLGQRRSRRPAVGGDGADRIARDREQVSPSRRGVPDRR